MARSKRQYGSGCLLKRGKGWAIRWREMEIAPDGTRKKVLRYESLGEVTRKQAADTLAQRITAAGNGKATTRSRVTFRTLAGEWEISVLPMYKHSTQKHRRFMLKKHLLPQFGEMPYLGGDAAGDPGLRGPSHEGRVRAQVHRSHSRCAERGAAHCGEMGPPPGEPGAGRRFADAQMCPSEVGVDDGAGSGARGGPAAAPADDGRSGHPLRPSTRRAVCAALEGHRREGAACSRFGRRSTTGRSARRRPKPDLDRFRSRFRRSG